MSEISPICGEDEEMVNCILKTLVFKDTEDPGVEITFSSTQLVKNKYYFIRSIEQVDSQTIPSYKT